MVTFTKVLLQGNFNFCVGRSTILITQSYLDYSMADKVYYGWTQALYICFEISRRT